MPLFAADALSDRAEAWLAAKPERLAVSDLAEAEFVAALGAKVRARAMSEVEAAAAVDNLAEWTRLACQRVILAPQDMEPAKQWMRRFDLGLRTPDALHLALATRFGLTVATFDAGMAAAARALRLPIVMP